MRCLKDFSTRWLIPKLLFAYQEKYIFSIPESISIKLTI